MLVPPSPGVFSAFDLVRAPVASVASFEKAHLDQLWSGATEFSPRTLAELIWVHSHLTIGGFLATLDDSRGMQVFYEDLVQYPQRELMAICTVVGGD